MTKPQNRVTVSVEQLEEALPDILEQHGDDLIHEARKGRVLVVFQAAGAAIGADGTFTWQIKSLETDEFARLAQLMSDSRTATTMVRDITSVRETNDYPIVLVAADKARLWVVHPRSN